MANTHLEPAASIISKIGASKIAEITGKDISRVYRWRAPKERGGTGGVIPHEDAEKLLAAQCEHGFSLEAFEFFEAKSDPALLTSQPEQPEGARS